MAATPLPPSGDSAAASIPASQSDGNSRQTSASNRPGTTLSTPVQFLRGVGPQRGELLWKLGIHTASDVLFNFPRDYQFPAPRTTIDNLTTDTAASIAGKIVEIDSRVTHSGKLITGVLVEDPTGAARLLFFNQPGRVESLRRGARYLISGVTKLNGLRFEFVHPQLIQLEDDEDPQGSILPVYPLTEGLKQPAMRKIAAGVVEAVADSVTEVLPESIRESKNLMRISEALRQIHQPADPEMLTRARRRFIFQELLVQQLALAMRRRRLTTDLKSPPLLPSPEINSAIERRFPFALTNDQRNAIRDVGNDMSRQFPMNRLIQGDVGSGKTVVAQYAMMLAVAHHQQAILMAPTDVLARQHQRTFERALSSSRVRIGLLTGSLKPQERRDTLAKAAAGEIDLLIGTQALLSDGISIPKLALVVIDEQHKFGVNQRARLRGDGLDPHYLVLSATPIPRTMAMTMFGDLEVSTLREKPPGRGEVKTYLAKDGWRERWWKFVAQRLDEGRQAYVVTPLVARKSSDQSVAAGDVNESEIDVAAEDVSSAEAIFEQLSSGPLSEYRVGLLHGRLSNDEKNDIMRRFAEGRLQVLVATTVIEVGIDVPNATVMTILGAERFGLAQLHQLRGRVSRGKHVGHVGVFTDGPGSPEENERLKVLAETTDGFELAEADFRLRGPGDLLGTRQSGLPPLRVADTVRDAKVLSEARDMARELIEEDPRLEMPGFELLRNQVLKRYGAKLDLGDVA